MPLPVHADQAVPVYGNYHGYYSKRPFIQDPRLALLPAEFFVGKRVLDVGCNEGWVTCEIGQSRGARQVVGVDIDDTLIRAAWKRRRTVWSLQSPECGHLREESCPPPKRQRVLGDAPTTDHSAHNYFPASCEHSYGSLPIPNRGCGAFPHNVTFRTVDWVKDEIPDDPNQYDIVLGFSISKWIHLNNKDEGLKEFFYRVHQCLKMGGIFVLEPQPWDTYSKARRMSETLKENAKYLQLRPDGFGELLQELGFSHGQRLGVTGKGGFRRPVDVYLKQR
ncbi:Bicoid-interacting protein 3-domain-containing protein [Suillus plorans]|uniref:RNA methyltransferase n=1 Tax=Suillus plorans TaxID=116603 RepID=A0A9P7AJE5_9AGAM|nr:Bicoid-interacting protein 3-domain-containing protein [Suillus plorans]KAG1790661.1 Bicoid-interacting protein 3-domain-containing protein [Suillus plorans]